MKHWDELESDIRDLVNEPDTVNLPQARLVRWANQALRKLPNEIQLSKARIVISIGSGVVALVDEDWPGTEFVGTPTYQAGRDGTFYIRYAEKVDSIRELKDRGTYDDCGVYTSAWTYVEWPLYKTRQEYITRQIEGAGEPTHYGVYRYMVYTPRSPVDNPRPLTRPLEVWAVWLDYPFDPAAVGPCNSEITFIGAGLNDMGQSGNYTGVAQQRYLIQIDGVAPDTFRWSDNGGAVWTAGVAITGAAQLLSNGISVTFGAILGHTLNDLWAFDCMPIERYFEVQYRRRPPEIDLTLLCLEYTQPYLYIPEVCEDVILYYSCAQALFSLGDNRWRAMKGKYTEAKRMVKWNLADRGDVDSGWSFDPVDPPQRVVGGAGAEDLNNYGYYGRIVP